MFFALVERMTRTACTKLSESISENIGGLGLAARLWWSPERHSRLRMPQRVGPMISGLQRDAVRSRVTILHDGLRCHLHQGDTGRQTAHAQPRPSGCPSR